MNCHLSARSCCGTAGDGHIATKCLASTGCNVHAAASFTTRCRHRHTSAFLCSRASMQRQPATLRAACACGNRSVATGTHRLAHVHLQSTGGSTCSGTRGQNNTAGGIATSVPSRNDRVATHAVWTGSARVDVHCAATSGATATTCNGG